MERLLILLRIFQIAEKILVVKKSFILKPLREVLHTI